MKKLYWVTNARGGAIMNRPSEDYAETEKKAKMFVSTNMEDAYIYELMAVASAPVPEIEITKVS